MSPREPRDADESALSGDSADAAPAADALPDDPEAPGVLPIEDSIDLHGFQPRDIPSVVEEYTRAAAERGFREVRLIHGRGTGFQRRRVREVLATLVWVERFADAPPTRGGWGATLVWLSPLRE